MNNDHPVKSMLDNDLYTFSQQMAFLCKFPDISCTMGFINRAADKNRFNKEAIAGIKDDIENMSQFALTKEEYDYLRLTPYYSFLAPWYLEYLRNFRFDPRHIDFLDDGEGRLNITVGTNPNQPIANLMPWEMPLLMIVNHNYYKHVDAKWNHDGQQEKLETKSNKLSNHGCVYSEFGTRRRRDYFTQDLAVQTFKGKPGFVGTSNVHLAHKHGVNAKGTQSHFWIMTHMVTHSIAHCNRYAMQNWIDVFGANLGTVLTDTVGSEAFFRDFTAVYAKAFDGVRHDSGDPFKFADRTINHYKQCGINPMHKYSLFSDALTDDKAIEITDYCKGRLPSPYGIGTFFTNDYGIFSPALNVVVKPRTIGGKPVVKLSDSPSKATGDKDALRVTKWEVDGTPLD